VTKKPFFRAFDGCWYAQTRTPGGKRHQVKLRDRDDEPVRGRENEQAAWDAFHRLMAGDAIAPPERITVAQVCDAFLEWSANNNDAQTYGFYKNFLQRFCDAHGTLRAGLLKPYHVTKWVDAQTYRRGRGKQERPWGPTTKGHAITAVKRAFAFAVEQGLLREEHNGVRRVKKPSPNRRERLLTPEERSGILAGVKDRPFREFVFAMQESGCRPGEIRKLGREHVHLDAGLWVFPPRKHKTGKKTGRPRVIYLTPALAGLTRELLARHSDGCLFRNSRGEPWTVNAVRIRFRNLRKRVPHLKDVVAYCYRHSFCTEGLVNGVPIAQMQELLGHTTSRVIETNYGHLAEKREHLRQAALKATGRGECASGAATAG
jgi:integrase